MMSLRDQYSKEFVRELDQISQRHNRIEAFGDFVGMMAASFWTATAPDREQAEKAYRVHADRYNEGEMAHVEKMCEIVVRALQVRRESFLGQILEDVGAAAKHNGQFLTPADVANLMARINADGVDYTPGKVIRVSDPACGAGVTLIAQGEALMTEKHVPQRDIFISGGDIDKRACDMTFIELSLLGYAARVDHLNSLTMQELSPSRYTLGYFLHDMHMRGIK